MASISLCRCDRMDVQFSRVVSASLPIHMLREPHSTDPHHLTARSDTTVTKRTQLNYSRFITWVHHFMSVPEENRQFPLLCAEQRKLSILFRNRHKVMNPSGGSRVLCIHTEGLHQHPPNCPQVALHDDDLEVVGVDQLISLSSQISSVNREDNTMSS